MFAKLFYNFTTLPLHRIHPVSPITRYKLINNNSANNNNNNNNQSQQ